MTLSLPTIITTWEPCAVAAHHRAYKARGAHVAPTSHPRPHVVLQSRPHAPPPMCSKGEALPGGGGDLADDTPTLAADDLAYEIIPPAAGDDTAPGGGDTGLADGYGGVPDYEPFYPGGARPIHTPLTPASPAPEPSTWALLMVGVFIAGLRLCARSKISQTGETH